MLILGNCLDVLPTLTENSIHCVVTSPPYFGLRDYGHGDQIGLEPTPEQYVAKLVEVFRQVWRVLREDGTVFLNLGDSYNSGASGGLNGSTLGGGQTNQANSNRSEQRCMIAGLKPKDLIGIPWRVAFALQADGWYLRSDIIWHKPNPMPESVTDRPTKAHEYVFLLTKAERYFYDAAAIAEPLQRSTVERYQYGWNGVNDDHSNGARTGSAWAKMKNGATMAEAMGGGSTRNRRSVWTIATAPYSGAHFATFPSALVEPCILAGCPVGGTVLDPFAGSGTVGAVARATGREFVGIEINADYIRLAEQRIGTTPVPLIVGR